MGSPDRRPNRIFLAAVPPDAVRARLADLAEGVAARWGGRPVPAANLHLTLCFLGAVEPDALPEVVAAVRGLAPPVAPRGRVTGVVGRPASRGPRLCAAVVRDEEGLVELMRHARERLSVLLGRTPPDRPPWPHITLARFRRVTSVEASTLPYEHAFPFDRMSIYDSRTVHGGPPEYIPVATVRLGTVHSL